MNKVRWKASFSNGETAYEGKGHFVEISDEMSPWNKLVQYVSDNDLEITSLSLWTKDGRNFHVPSSGSSPRFSLFAKAEKPVDYRFFNAVTSSQSGGEQKSYHYVVVEAVYEDYRLQMWVDENNPSNCWCLCLKD